MWILYVLICSLHVGHALQLLVLEISVSVFMDAALMLNTAHLSRWCSL